MGRPEVSFHTAGKQHPYNDSYITINQAYVHYTPPAGSHDSQPTNTASIPILFVHGGALTGAMWESTPDRRPGWATLASRPPFNRPVYCIDAVDSGRSQRCPDASRPAEIEHRTAADMWQRFRFGPSEDASKANANSTQRRREPWPDLQFPLECSDRLLASQSARRRGRAQYEAEAEGLRDAIAEIGGCDVVAHSNGCAVFILALLDEAARAKVRSSVLVEPGPPHTPALEHVESVRKLVVWGDHLAGHEMWDPITAHYQEMKGDVTVWELPKMGINGNSHFPMHDRNSDEIGKMVLDWLEDP